MGLAHDLARLLTDGATVIIGGDLNIQAPDRSLRVSIDPDVDCAPAGGCDGLCGPGGADGYDDSIPILLEAAPEARLLGSSTTRSSRPEAEDQGISILDVPLASTLQRHAR